MMKTSLMARKKNDRKNSDSIGPNTVKSVVLRTQPWQKPAVSIFDMGRGELNSPKEAEHKR
jgi:hypothetical protein